MRTLETTSGDLETTSQFGTWKQLPGNKCGRVAGGYGNCWRLRRLLDAAAGCLWGPQYDEKCSFCFNHYFSIQLQLTKATDRNVLRLFHDVYLVVHDQYGFSFLGSNVHLWHICTAKGPSVTVWQIFECVHFPMNLHSILNECNEISYAPCEYGVNTYSL